MPGQLESSTPSYTSNHGSHTILAMNPPMVADMGEYIKMADGFGLKENDKVR